MTIASEVNEEYQATLVPLLIVPGTSRTLNFTVTENGMPMDITGMTPKAVIWRRTNDAEPIAEFELLSRSDVAGTFTMRVSRPDTMKLGYRDKDAQWACSVISQDGQDARLLAHGPVALEGRAP